MISLRARLLVLLLIVGSLLGADRAFDIVRSRDVLIAAERDRLRSLAATGASRQEDLVSDVRAILTVVAEMPVSGAWAGNACHHPFARTVAAIPWLVSIGTLGLDGRMICTSRQRPAATGFADRDYFKKVIETRSFVLSDYITLRHDNRAGLVASLPRIVDGEIETVVFARIDVDWLSGLLTRIGESSRTVVILTDGAGSIVSAFPDRDGLAGAKASSIGLAEEIDPNHADLIEASGPDGEVRLWAVAPLRHTGGRLFVGVARDAILASIRRDVAYAVIKLVGGLLACAGLLWLGVERLVVRPARTLAWTSARLGAGDLAARADESGMPSEFVDLSRALNGMASRLAQRDAELRTVNEHLAALATVDALTGLANRRLFDERLAQEWRRAQRAERPLGLVMVDIDHFKSYNDTYGHPAGDACLVNVARIIGADLRPGDLAARVGGEEFALLLPGSDLHMSLRVARLLRLEVQSAGILHVGIETGVVTASVGVASMVPPPGAEAKDLIRAADEALYDAKRRGRNRVSGPDRAALAS